MFIHGIHGIHTTLAITPFSLELEGTLRYFLASSNTNLGFWVSLQHESKFHGFGIGGSRGKLPVVLEQ